VQVPFVDLRAQYLAHKEEFDGAMAAVIQRSAFVGGEFVRRFEAEFARAIGAKHCIACANGTDAIYIVLRMLGIGPGHEVMTSAMTWISTAETITQAGATPIFVDIDDYFTIDVRKVAEAITPCTKAVIPVHLYGQPVDMTPLLHLCKSRGLHVIEDCAQAHLARVDGAAVGTLGTAATFSFFPGKNLGAYGDAGAIVTSDPGLADRFRAYANHGALEKHEHLMEGINSRLDGLQASLLSAKLRHLKEWTERRRSIAALYDAELESIPGVERPSVRPNVKHVYHLYVIRARNRDGLRAHLEKKGIGVQVHYPRALPFLPAYSRFGFTLDSFPNAASVQAEILSLPIYAELSDEAVRYVARCIREFYRK
jgi:dTDP-4-amino-4,6-dideoxygalactose transaminase